MNRLFCFPHCFHARTLAKALQKHTKVFQIALFEFAWQSNLEGFNENLVTQLESTIYSKNKMTN